MQVLQSRRNMSHPYLSLGRTVLPQSNIYSTLYGAAVYFHTWLTFFRGGGEVSGLTRFHGHMKFSGIVITVIVQSAIRLRFGICDY